MTLITNVYRADFHDLFKAYGREDEFSYNGFNLLFDHLETLSDDMGRDLKIDIIGLCTEYIEKDMMDIVEAYNIDISGLDKRDQFAISDVVTSFLIRKTEFVGRHGNTMLFMQF